MLSRLFITFLPKSNHLLISRLQSSSAVILDPFKIYFSFKTVTLAQYWSITSTSLLTSSETLFFWAPKSLQMVTAAMKLRCLLIGRKVMTNLDSILKGIDITLLTKVHLVKAMVFPMVMYGYESWTIRKAEHQRMDAFEL